VVKIRAYQRLKVVASRGFGGDVSLNVPGSVLSDTVPFGAILQKGFNIIVGSDPRSLAVGESK
jgi:hypothetical protein